MYYHLRVWSEKDETGVSILDKVLQKLMKQIRNENLRRDKTTFGIVDTPSVRNYVDTMGLPHAIAVTIADVTDRDGAIQMILLNLDNLSHVEKFLVDAVYSGR